MKAVTEDDLQGYVDGALDTRRAAEVEAYLARHPDVAQRVAKDADLRQALKNALDPIAAEPVPAEISVTHILESRRRRATFQASRWRAAAAVLLLLLGGAGGWFAKGLQEPAAGVASLTREAADSYVVYAPETARPVEITAMDQAQLVDLAARRLNRKLVAPDLSQAGFRFVGGRLIPTPHGPAVLYIFDDVRGARIMMLTRNMAVDQNTPMTEERSDAFRSVTWSHDGLGFSFVGPANTNDLRAIADSAKAQLGAAT